MGNFVRIMLCMRTKFLKMLCIGMLRCGDFLYFYGKVLFLKDYKLYSEVLMTYVFNDVVNLSILQKKCYSILC